MCCANSIINWNKYLYNNSNSTETFDEVNKSIYKPHNNIYIHTFLITWKKKWILYCSTFKLLKMLQQSICNFCSLFDILYYFYLSTIELNKGGKINNWQYLARCTMSKLALNVYKLFHIQLHFCYISSVKKK